MVPEPVVAGIAGLTVIVTKVMKTATAIAIPGKIPRVIAVVAKAKKALPVLKARADLALTLTARAQGLALRVGRKGAGRFGPKRAFQRLNWAA
jgi:hypothetical protein